MASNDANAPPRLGLLGVIRRLGRYLRPYWAPCVLIVVALVVELGYRTFVPLGLKFLIDQAIEPQDASLLATVLAALAGAFIIAALAGLARDYLSAQVGVDLLNRLRLTMWDHLHSLPMDFYTRAQAGDIMARFTGDLAVIQSAVTRALPEATSAGLQVIVTIVLLISLDWRLGAITLLALPAAALGPRLFGPPATRASYERNLQEGTILNLLQEHVGAQPVVRAYGLEESGQAQFRRQLADLATKSVRASFLGRLTARTSDIGQICVQLLIVALGAYWAFQGLLTIGSLTAFIVLLFEMGDALQVLTRVTPDLLEASGGVLTVEELLSEKPGVVDAADAATLQQVADIRFEDVSFSYTGDRVILNNVSFTIPAGQSVAFVGRSGSGKSTILNLITRFYDPNQGHVVVNGQDLQEVSQASLRQHIGAVFQDSYLFNTTVRENIRLGRPDATDAEVEQAARLAELHEQIIALPDGYDTEVGERGSRLSGGQRQRVALARAILRNPSVLVLDEATSALDPETEADINETLERLANNRTVISVTHRLASALHADRIFVLDHGEVVEQGTHEQLLALQGIYAQMWQLQSGFVLGEGGRRAEVHPERLRAIPLFHDVERSTLALLADRFVSERFPEGRVIFVEGDPGDKFYLIVRGTIEVLRRGPDGNEQLVAVLQDGDFFGEMALLGQVPRNATIRTRTPCIMLSLDERQFHDLLDLSPALRTMVEQTAAARERENTALRQGAELTR